MNEIFDMWYWDVQHADVIRWSMVRQYTFTAIYFVSWLGTKWTPSPYLCHYTHKSWQGKKFVLQNLHTHCGAHPVSHGMGTRKFFSWVKWLGCKSEHSPPPKAEVTDEWNGLCFPICLHDLHGVSFTIVDICMLHVCRPCTSFTIVAYSSAVCHMLLSISNINFTLKYFA